MCRQADQAREGEKAPSEAKGEWGKDLMEGIQIGLILYCGIGNVRVRYHRRSEREQSTTVAMVYVATISWTLTCVFPNGLAA